jgi:hypothetical protein
MPTKVRRSILTLLYALRTMSNAAGELRFNGDRKPIRIQDIAKAAGADEKDCRRYLQAAVAAGVVAVKGEQKRGKPTLYVLVLHPRPDWDAAEAVLNERRRKSGKSPAPWKDHAESSGDRDRNQFGGPRPELEAGEKEEVRGTAPRWSSGDRAPFGSGDRAPNNPGIAKELPQDMAEVGEQPQVVDAPPGKDQFSSQGQDHHDDPPPAAEPRAALSRCTGCGIHLIPRSSRPGRTTCHACDTANAGPAPPAERTAS